MPSATVVVDVSGLGFGHLAQMGPVIDHLGSKCPRVRIVVRANHPPDIVRQFISTAVELRPLPPEVTLVSRGPDAMDFDATVSGFESLHERWDHVVEAQAARLGSLDPSVLVSNVPYVSLAAAARLSIPSIALCSINWLDVFRFYFLDSPAAPQIMRDMREAYESADTLLQMRPHMPMNDLPNRRSIGPIARTGSDRRSELRRVLCVPPKKSIVLVTMGGVAMIRPIQLPFHDRIQWLVQGRMTDQRADIVDAAGLDFPFIDLMASVDVVVSKDSYGTITEAACHGTRLVIVPRPQSIEFASLGAWARDHATIAVATDLYDPEGLLVAILEVLSLPPAEPASRAGINEAVEVISTKAGIHQPRPSP